MEFINTFKNYLLSNTTGASKVTVKNYLADVKQFISWVEATYNRPFAPGEINSQTIHAFKLAKQADLSASSVERHLSSLRKFFTFLKLNGDIASSPFDVATKSSEEIAKEDPWHLHDFKNYLYVYNASHLTIKNYIIDVKQFLSWAEEVLQVKEAWQVAEKNVLRKVNASLIEEYKMRLLEQKVFSPASINRKLSSLRKYIAWAGEQGYLDNPNDQWSMINNGRQGVAGVGVPQKLPATRLSSDAISGGDNRQDPGITYVANTIQSERQYSNIPPVRLFQKVGNAGTWVFDSLISVPVAFAFRKAQHGHWTLKGKPLFVKSPISLPTQVKSLIPNIKNISKEFYAPLSLSISNLPWHKKALFHIRYTRPTWYRRYHQLAIAHYFNWAVLIIFASAIGFGMYNNFVAKPGKSLAALPTAPLRVLSFQGRLTDANDNPITTPSWIRFEVYNDVTASGAARLWEEADKVTPDQDGIFSIYLGSNGSGGTAALCNGNNPPASPATGACGIPSTLFSANNALWLGVTVENTAELTPREQLATVAYASNSETLQGLPPITQSGAGTNNVVLALNSSGNLAIGASTTFQSTSGQFTLSGNTLALNTNAGTNGNITLTPDGSGFIDLQKPVQNSTLNNNIPSAAGAVEIDDIAAILATSSGQSALTIDQNGTGPIISASHSGTAEFTLSNGGNGTFNGNVTGQTIFTGGGTTYYINNATSNLNSLTLAGNLVVSGKVASDLSPSVTDTYSLGDASHEWLNLYAKNIYSNGLPINSYWQENLGALAPVHTQDDLLLGDTATTGAGLKFGFLNVASGTPTATISSNLSLKVPTGANPASSFNLLNGGSLGFYTATQGKFDAGLSASPALFIANSGSIGIGTSTPLAQSGIDVEKNGLGNSVAVFNQTGSGDILTASASGSPKFVITNAGNVGINIVNPSAPLQVLNTSSGATTIPVIIGNGSSTTNTGAKLAFNLSTTNNNITAYIAAVRSNSPGSSATYLSFATNPGPATTEALRLSELGGAGFETSAIGNGVVVINQTNTSGLGDLLSASASGVTKFTVQNDGTIVSGKYTTAGGVFYTTSTGVFTQASNASANTVLHGGTTPSFSAVDLTADVTGTLPINKGGTNGTATPSNGQVAYGTGTAYAFTSGGTNGQCLTFNSGSAPTWGTCSSGSASNFWTLDSANGVLYPVNTTLDFFVGGSATTSAKFAVLNDTGSGTPTASVSSGLNGNATSINATGSIQTARNQTLTLGGSTTGNITLSPQGGSGIVSINGPTLDATGNTFGLLPTPTTINFGAAASTLNIGAAGGTTTFKAATLDDNQATVALLGTPTTINLGSASQTDNILGNSTLGTTTSNTVTLNGLVSGAGANNAVQPVGNGVTDLGSAAHYWGTVYANNFISPVSGGTSGFWQLTSNVLSPVNFWNDLAVGGNATGSATPFQVFATTVGVNTAGTASTSGNLAFRGASSEIDLLNGTGLNIKGSPGGNAGLTSLFNIDNAGNVTAAGNAAINGGSITSTASVGSIFPTSVTTLTIGGAATNETLKGNLTIGTNSSNTVSFNSLLTSDLLPFPSGGPFNLGGLNNRFGTVYANNLNLPVAGGTGGYWTLASSVLSPTNNWNDLAVGGTATGSATAYQVFANAFNTQPAGTASSSGDLTLRGTPGSQTAFGINLLNGSSLAINRSVGGDSGLVAVLTIGNDGNIIDAGNLAVNGGTITSSGGTTTIGNTLTVTGNASLNGNTTLGDASADQITVNGQFISSLIPATTDTYNLGSDPNAGGQEWNNLYVRQIFASNTGGVAGYWQLNNGAIAPTNVTNDVLTGGIATASATFHLTGASRNQGTLAVASVSAHTSFAGLVVDNTVGDLFTASSSGLNRFVITQNGNIGIGTTTPIDKFANTPTNILDSLGTGTTLNNSITWSVNAAGYAEALYNLSSASNANGLLIKATGTAATNKLFSIDTGSSQGSAGTNLFTVQGNGSVGIGTPTPLASTGLDIEKNALGNATLVINQLGLGDIITASVSGNTKFVITNDGNVGIGNLNSSIMLAKTGLEVKKDSLGNALALFQQTGNAGDLLVASDSANTNQFRVTNTGNIYGRIFTDLDNPIYYLDPAGLSISASVAGSMTFTPAAEHDINYLNGSAINFQRSVGGDAGLLSTLYLGGNGNVGVGTTSAQTTLQVVGDFLVGKDNTIWGETNWKYRKQLKVANPSSQTQMYYQVRLVINTATLVTASKMQSDCGDLRFTDSDGATELSYWVESGCNTNQTIVWVKVPSLTGLGKSIYLYYGNTGQTTQSSTANTFNRTISNVVGAYRLDEPLYDPIVDYSGNNNTATTTATTVTSGIFNNARLFDGSTTFASMSASPTLNPTTFTYTAWVNPTTVSALGTIIGSGKAGGPQFRVNASGQLDLVKENTTDMCHSTPALTANVWSYVGVSYSGGTSCTFMINGAIVAGTSTSATQFIYNNLVLGKNGAAGTEFFNGSMDEVRIYSATLGSADFAATYSNGGNVYGYVTPTSPGNEYLRQFATPEPNVTSYGQEQSSLQLIPAFYVQQGTGNVALGTTSVGTSSALLTVAGDVKSGLYDPTSWGNTFNASSFRSKITIDNTLAASSSANANYDVQVTVNTKALIAANKMRSDCNDVVFSDSDGTTNLPYWMESGCNTTNTLFWIKVPLLPPGGKKTIYMYYGNLFAAGANSTSSIFIDSLSNLVGGWHLDESSGNAIDSSTFGLTLTQSNTLVGGGAFNNARLFNGSNSKLTIADSSPVSTSNLDITGSFTISAWILTNSNAQQGIVEKFNGGGTNGYVFRIQTGGKLLCQALNGSGAIGTQATGNTVISTGVWHHVTCVNNTANSTISTYIDGVLDSSGSSGSPTHALTSTFTVGQRGDNINNSVFSGSIDEVLVFNTALTSAQVTELSGKGNYLGAFLGYASTNTANTVYVRPFENPEPSTTIDTEQDTSQVNTTFAVNNAFGRVGIGTSNPSAELDIQGNINGQDLFTASSSGTTRFVIQSGGNVGIGVSNPTNGQLEISSGNSTTLPPLTLDTSGSGGILLKFNDDRAWQFMQSGSGATTALELRSTVGQKTFFIDDNQGTNALTVAANGASSQVGVNTNTFGSGKTFQVGSACTNVGSNSCVDYAEFYPSSVLAEAADLMSIDTATNAAKTVTYSTMPYDPKTIGIVSTNPAITIDEGVIAVGGDGNTDKQVTKPSYKPPIALAGRVPAKVSTINGPINRGDMVTTSSLVAFGMKATQAGPVVGEVMEDFDPAHGQNGEGIVPCPEGTPNGVICGTTYVFVHTGWYDPDVYLTSTGDYNIHPALSGEYALTDASGNPVTRMGAYLSAVIANLQVGHIDAQSIATNSLAIATANVTVAGQSLHDYVASIVQDVINNSPINNGQSITSPVASINEVHTNIISPLSDNPQIALTLNNSTVAVKNTTSNQVVASIDNNGNATFSGTLSSENLAVNGDATVSGTLYADKIKANSIEGLSEVVGTLSAQNITNVTNILFATPSAVPTGENFATGFNGSSSSSSGALNYSNSFANIASYSAFFAYVPNLKATTGLFDQGLVSLGPTSLTDTSITGQLAIGSQMILADTSLNVLGSDFAIQPLRQGGVNFEGGLLAIDTAGNLTVNGNAVFNKNLAVNTLSPIAGHNFNINLANGAATGSALPNLTVNNASGSGIFAVNQLGDLVASGAATIGKLNLTLVQPALAVSNTEVVATGSAGTANIKAYQREVTIDNKNVTANSLIYITPVGTNQTPYLERQVSGTSFSVGIPASQSTDVNFNWLIVN